MRMQTCTVETLPVSQTLCWNISTYFFPSCVHNCFFPLILLFINTQIRPWLLLPFCPSENREKGASAEPPSPGHMGNVSNECQPTFCNPVKLQLSSIYYKFVSRSDERISVRKNGNQDSKCLGKVGIFRLLSRIGQYLKRTNVKLSITLISPGSHSNPTEREGEESLSNFSLSIPYLWFQRCCAGRK